MNRREALKNIGLSFGSALASPTLVSILNSCTAPGTDWTPEFFNASEKYLAEHLVHIILFSGNSSIENQYNIAQFIDKMMKHTVNSKSKKMFHNGASEYKSKFELLYGKKALNGRREEFDELFSLYFNLSEDREQQVFEELRIPVNEVPQHKKSNYLIYKFLIQFRYYCLLGYFTSKEVIENNPYHNDNLGYYTGCTDL